jgi:hypothetical protein
VIATNCIRGIFTWNFFPTAWSTIVYMPAQPKLVETIFFFFGATTNHQSENQKAKQNSMVTDVHQSMTDQQNVCSVDRPNATLQLHSEMIRILLVSLGRANLCGKLSVDGERDGIHIILLDDGLMDPIFLWCVHFFTPPDARRHFVESGLAVTEFPTTRTILLLLSFLYFSVGNVPVFIRVLDHSFESIFDICLTFHKVVLLHSMTHDRMVRCHR